MADSKRTKESYYTESYKTKQAEKTNRIYGHIKIHKKTCERCGNNYEIEGRENTNKIKKSRFCSRSCANHRGVGLEWEKTHKSRSLAKYRTICFTEWEQKCVVCGYDKIVDVHHLDENRKNNNVNNLIPLCPNHHQELHHRDYEGEIKKIITEKVKQKWGIS